MPEPGNNATAAGQRTRAWFNAALVAAGVAFWIWLISRGWKVGSGPHSDFAFFYHAAVAARTGDDMYAVHGGGYVYPPLFAVLLEPLGRLELVTAARVWTVLLAAALPLALHLWTSAISRRLGGLLGQGPGHLDRWAIGAVAVIALGQTWKSEFQYGNSNLCLILAAAVAFQNLGRRPWLVGFALAFAVSIKYFPIVALPYLLIRRRWAEAAWFITALVVLALVPAIYLGWDRNLECLTTALRGVLEMMRIIPRGGGAGIIPVEAGYSLAITSTMSRWEQWMNWPARTGLAASAVIAAMCVALAAAMYRRAGVPLFAGRGPAFDDSTPAGRCTSAMEWVVLLAAAIVFSPQGTHRHLNMLLSLLIFGGVLVWSEPVWRRRVPATLGVMVFVVGAAAIPGVPGWRRATELWNQGGGAAACILVMIFAIVWTALARARTAPRSGA